MLRLTAEVRSGVQVQVEAETQKELYQQFAEAWEVFSEDACGLCGSSDIRPQWRTVTSGKKTYEYAEYQCLNLDCRAHLALSMRQEGDTMFPNRALMPNGKPRNIKDGEKGAFGAHNGWTKYRGESTDDQPDDSRPAHDGDAPVVQNERSHVSNKQLPKLNDQPGTLTREQKTSIEQYAMKFGWKHVELCEQLHKKIGVDNVTLLSERQAAAVIGGLKAKADRESSNK